MVSLMIEQALEALTFGRYDDRKGDCPPAAARVHPQAARISRARTGVLRQWSKPA